jgi:regulator of sigma E protease
LEPHNADDRQPSLSPTPETNISATPPVEAPPAPVAPLTLGDWFRQNASMLGFVAVLLLAAYKFLGLTGMLNAAVVVLGLGFVIFIHELGHFAVAKWCDVHVKTFSIGFGPALPGCTYQRGETTYMIGALPLGGYVQMVGEGSEEEDDVDPRSFKHKKVWQRMAIISAGVIMNVILGAICFMIVYKVKGVERPPGVVAKVDPGSPAWVLGVPSGATIYRIGTAENPYFDDLMPEVVNSWAGQKLPIEFGEPGQPIVHAEIEPRKKENDNRPVIGVMPSPTLQLPPPDPSGKDKDKNPCGKGTAGAEAKNLTDSSHPTFQWSDHIVATTDPNQTDKYDPNKLKDLPEDPRLPNTDHRLDYFEYARRMQDLAGKPVVIQVRRDKTDTKENLLVPATYRSTFGLQMRMGRVVAVRKGSSAENQVHVATGADGKTGADLIDSLEVTDVSGKPMKWARDPKGMGERPLDPIRLPVELANWAATATNKTVKVTVLRLASPDSPKPNGHEEASEQVLELKYDDSPVWKYDSDAPLNTFSPVAISGLGIAYQVDTVVDAVEPGAPSATKGDEKGEPFTFQKNDLIKGVCFYEPARDDAPAKPVEKPWWFFWKVKAWNEGDKMPGWPYLTGAIQDKEDKRVIFKVERNKEEFEVYMAPKVDETWGRTTRGIPLMPDLRLQKADTYPEAVAMGMARTKSMIVQVYHQLPNLFTGRISSSNLMGPLGIADTAYRVAGTDWFFFIFFMGVMSVNLAVVNFLPIPVLDGGHMVFLIWEAIRGKPASEQVKMAANYVGLGLILSLMIFVLWIDIARISG